MSKKSKKLVPTAAVTDAERAKALNRLLGKPAPEATGSPTAAPGASGGEVAATAGSPVPPKGGGKGGKSAKHLKAVAAADQANARARDERAASKEGMTASERAMAKSAKAKPAKEPKPKKPKKVSGLDAAALVLAESKTPLNCKQVFAEVQSRKLWTTKGATPEATLYAAIIREIRAKGRESRFKKMDRGLFTANKKGA